MRRVAIAVACVLVAAALANAIVSLVVPSPWVYSVDEVQAGLQRPPRPA